MKFMIHPMISKILLIFYMLVEQLKLLEFRRNKNDNNML